MAEVSILSGFSDAYTTLHPNITIEQVRSVKLVEYVRRTTLLDDMIASRGSHLSEWKQAIEGNTLAYFQKIQKLSELADDPRVETICEIGFNCGYSALNFLTANPTARFISFDLFSNHYVPAAVQSLHEMFPERSITVVAGSSFHSVPKTFEMFGQAKMCNLVFIDGGHTADDLAADVLNMARFTNLTYNRFVIDDIHFPHLRAVWDAVVEQTSLGFYPLEIVDSKAYGCIVWEAIEPLGYKFPFNETKCEESFRRQGLKYDFRPGSLGVGEIRDEGVLAAAAAGTENNVDMVDIGVGGG